MGIIKNPSELEVKNTISVLVYGQPGVGKTTLGCSAPTPVLFDYDGGVGRINGAHQVPTVQIRSWEDTGEALEEIRRDMPEVRTIVIDTVGKLLDYMSDYIIRTDSKMAQRDGSLSLKGYGVRKNMFVDFMRKLTICGLNVVFIAHEKEEKRGDDTVKRPEVGGSSANDLVKEMDLVGYVEMIGRDRTISYNPTEAFYAKNSCNLPDKYKLPMTVDEFGVAKGDNDYLTKIVESFKEEQRKTKEITSQYVELIDRLTKLIDEVKTVDELNKVMEAIKGARHIYNSKLIVARRIKDKATQMGAKLDRVNEVYVQG